MTTTFMAAAAPRMEVAAGLRLSLSGLDITLLVIYFTFVIGIGFALRRLIQTSTDFFLSGRSLPAWITGIAFISANLGAIEILGMSASGAQYGISIVHYYWIGAVPAMVFLGIVMMPFYICAGLIPVVIVALKETGGISGLFAKLSTNGHDFASAWSGTGLGGHNPIGDWIGLVLGLSFCLSFGYWTTNFAEVQRAMSAKDDNTARLIPIIGAYPKAIIPLGIVIPGMAAVLLIRGLGDSGGLQYNYAIPALMNKYLPTGVLGVAITGLIAAFMAGMAANVSAFNAVWTYDIWQNYIRRGRPDSYYLRVGRITTVVGVFIGILTAFIAAGYTNIANYLQTLFSFFNVPIFLAFIVGMVWRKAGRGSGSGAWSPGRWWRSARGCSTRWASCRSAVISPRPSGGPSPGSPPAWPRCGSPPGSAHRSRSPS
jgi:Na+/proline symporter